MVAHNDYVQSTKEALDDLAVWTGKGHEIFLVFNEKIAVGFIHLGNRGARIDWIEDLFIKQEYQGNGFGSIALKLYRKNGFDC